MPKHREPNQMIAAQVYQWVQDNTGEDGKVPDRAAMAAHFGWQTDDTARHYLRFLVNTGFLESVQKGRAGVDYYLSGRAPVVDPEYKQSEQYYGAVTTWEEARIYGY